ncbi:hypothetical protein PSTT_12494 [Puccinia striiformis]|uniref:ATP-dependent RNA helicase n=1 Tax=Puccinia striiformis TaxID=27350 RepID=A0A2S4UW80_9BASI|nr:hypothetical protein PSTT_12494 [Puccinia striiformis]
MTAAAMWIPLIASRTNALDGRLAKRMRSGMRGKLNIQNGLFQVFCGQTAHRLATQLSRADHQEFIQIKTEMARPLKRTKRKDTENIKEAEAEEPRFDDNEPIGEIDEDEADESQLPIPSFEMGTDSTKPTTFDKLPWKKVRLPDFLGDGLSFDPDGGGLLGLEELDGSVWEDIKQSSRKRNLDQLEEAEQPEEPESPDDPNQSELQVKKDLVHLPQSGQDQVKLPISEVTTSQATVDKELRKQAKKERLAKLRQLKKDAQVNNTTPVPNTDSVNNAKTEPKRRETEDLDDEFEDVDWAATADLDGMSDMERDVDNQLIMLPFDDSLLPAWSHIKLASPLKRALYNLSFAKPTAVQEASLPVSLSSSDSPRDLVVIAETGSGKTLAYALPILNSLILSTPPPMLKSSPQVLPIVTLVLTPTRELCLQVKNHIDTFLKAMCSDTDDSKNRTGITTVSICGGIAIAKQRKQLERSKKLMEPGKGGLGCIVVATPGRLWDMIQSWDEFAEGIKRNLEWLILDEADKMVEKGHFDELEKILKLSNRPKYRRSQQQEDDHQNGEWQDEWNSKPRILITSLRRRSGLWFSQLRWIRIDFRDPHPELIDLTPEGRMVGGLKECKIECVLKDKAVCPSYPDRVHLRRLSPMLNLLLPNSTILSLHSEMQQRSRLKSLDRFRSSSNSILLSTDVAARGLDIPQIRRTARAGKAGVALALVAPDELKTWKSLLKNLGRVDDLPRIDNLEHKSTKQSHEENWIKKTAELLEIDLDNSNNESDGEDIGDSKNKKSGDNKSMSKAKLLRQELKHKLNDPIIIKNSSLIIRSKLNTQTKTRKLNNCFIKDPQIIENFINHSNHSNLVGLNSNVNALNDLS